MAANSAIPTEQKGQYATVNGLTMYYEVHGSGQPLVLIHGGGSTIRTNFGKILALLATKNKVIAVELQAHGHTPDRDTPSSFEQDADDVAELLRQLEIPPADILGFSNGGNTAMQLAIRNPQLVRKLIIASSFYKRVGMYDWFWEFMKDASIDSMPKVYQDEYFSITQSQEGLQRMHDRDARRMQTFEDWEDAALKSIIAPTLIISGDQDVVKPEHSVAMSRLITNARLAIFPANHGSYMGEIMSAGSDSRMPGLFVAMVQEFLEKAIPEK